MSEKTLIFENIDCNNKLFYFQRGRPIFIMYVQLIYGANSRFY